MQKIHWYYHRLKSMSPVEIAYRIQQKLKQNKYKQKYKKDISLLGISNRLENLDNNILKRQLAPFLKINELKKIPYSREIEVFNQTYSTNERIAWHLGMDGRWPSEKYSLDFSFRDKDDIGDIRFTWEINRHLFLVDLALQYKVNKDEEALVLVKKHFYDWINQNPFLKGVNWSSSMEVAIRAYQWVITYQILSESKEEQFLADLVQGIKNSIDYVMKNLSLHSSANNHLILEVAISSIIGYFLKPVYDQTWFEDGYEILQKQIPLQVYEDGVNKEQAVHYHAFVLDIMLQYNFFLQSVGKRPLHESIIYKMVEFLGYLKQGGSVTEIGDSDDAKIISVNKGEKDYYLYILQLASIYFKENFIDSEDVYPEVTLISGYVHSGFELYEYSKFREFRQGGYAFINQENHYIAFDMGPLGFGSIAAHGHADALSVIYHYNQKPILVDPGTYIYNIKKNWRDYFRKTSSHNTLSVYDKDQSIMNGPFLWSKKAQVKWIDSGETEELIYMIGSQDGYAPSIHQRAITYMKREKLLIISDEFNGDGQINFVFNNEIDLKNISKTQVGIRDNEIYMTFSKPYKIVEKWISKKFLEKKKTVGIEIEHDFSFKNNFFTIISEQELELEGNEFIYNNRRYRYENYKSIRSVMD